jgi:kumamolisin
MSGERVTLPGSAARPLAAEHAVADLDQGARMVVTLELRRKADPGGTSARAPLSRRQFASLQGATEGDFDRIRNFARQYGLTVVEESAAKRISRIAGTAAQVQAAFGVKPLHVMVSGRSYRHYSGEVSIPRELEGVVLSVLGLSDVPLARPHYRVFQPPPELRAAATARPYFADQVARLYRFPTGKGDGQTVALVELGGGVGKADLKAYFEQVKIQQPVVTAVGVAGGANAPGQDPGADGEVMLDVEVLGTVAPGARQFVYFGPNSDAGFLAAVQAAVHDTDPPPAAVSISWGAPESSWTSQAMNAMDRAFQDAATLGIPICVASGDNGSSDGTASLAVDFPASSPHALGCGGTRLEGTTSITGETVWNSGGGATGGGFSQHFARPSYQSIGGQARGVPDVAGNADPATGYRIRYDGQAAVVGGTSAVAPLWAGLITILAQALKRPVGFLNQAVYHAGTEKAGFRDVTSGDNDVGNGHGNYPARAGWDPCTGLGSPIGTALLSALKGASTKKPTRKKTGGKKKSTRKKTVSSKKKTVSRKGK